ncbi:M14 family metallopeptidase [Fictibacillus phosphorivorans]|uniref:M14 family metallopeptidase n=1 Tax=Fictibacillus phosphorivorans TaxID=1221500 RepID=UPI0020405629|nr:M14 family metallocarboxypeptidase [Fictibacillus phosphorivorans]MCM3718718.1 M14 family metallocarboxypeptidase [Fictibacillus phosphorivorans]MCM3776341.1 M14 family metallocarboxypeptidase [Fictibacillus phosphorivorans]
MKKRLSLFMAVMLAGIIVISDKAQAESYVNPNQTYTYETMTSDIKTLAQKYPGLVQYRSIGKTPYGRDIWAVKLGRGDATVLYNASHHAREWLTTNIVMEMIDQYSEKYELNGTMDGYNVSHVLNNTSIWFVPMTNPDGVTLQQKGLSAFPSSAHANLIKMNGGSKNFKRWKSNAQGIDLNRQYPARWEEIENNAKAPYYKDYKGKTPLQTNETKAITALTTLVDPEITTSYHTAGRILYYHFNYGTNTYEGDKTLGTTLSGMTGYRLIPPDTNLSSGGGYKDWFIQTYNRPGFTFELAPYPGETNPPLSVFSEEWNRNKKAGLYMAIEGDKRWEKRITSLSKTITLTQKVPLHDRPNNNHKMAAASLYPGTYKVNASFGNFYRIQTILGPKWILK